MKIGVIGAGYVGLTTGVCFSHMGHEVFVSDKESEKIKMLNDGIPPIYEPGLQEMLHESMEKGRLRFTTSNAGVVEESEIIFLCVGTPPKSDGSADLSQVEEASRDIARSLTDYRIIVEKSTVPVKTSYWIKRTIRLNLKKHVEFDVASNPEFLREGNAINDFMHPDRIVIGVETAKAREKLLELYREFSCPIIVTDIASAELIKHASNSFLALKISYANLIADICEKTGADVKLVTYGMGLDRRIGRDFLNAGIGYGGSCFPKDIKAFIKIGEELGVDMGLLKECDKINENRTLIFLEKIKKALWNISGKKITILGVAFKPGTDDVRQSPGLKLARTLLSEGAEVRLYDPKAIENARKVIGSVKGVTYHKDIIEALKGADAACIATEWDEIVNLNLEKAREVMNTPIFVDGRNIWEPEDLISKGVEYYPTGRSVRKVNSEEHSL